MREGGESRRPVAPAAPGAGAGRGAAPRRSRWRSAAPAAALALALLHGLAAASSVAGKSPTFDEPPHLAGGLLAWRLGDYRVNPANGILPKRWAALPLLAEEVALPSRAQQAWRLADQYALGRELLYERGNEPEPLVRRARLAMVLWGVALVGLLYATGRRLFGPEGGLVAAALGAASPTLLAHTRLVTSDFLAAAAFTAASLALWRALHRATAGTVLLGGLALGALALAKMSGALLAGVALLLAGLRVAAGRPLVLRLGRWRLRTRRRAALAAGTAGVLAAQALVVVLCIWAAFGFRYSAFHAEDRAESRFPPRLEAAFEGEDLPHAALRFAREHRLLPQAYLQGFALSVSGSAARTAFLAGEYSVTGWWYFFPYAVGVKTPLPVFAVGGLAGLALLRRERRAGRAGRRRRLLRGLYRTLPLWALLAVYGTVLLRASLNIGHRHALPLYPAAFLLAGAAGAWLLAPGRAGRVGRAALLAALALLAVESARVWPHYLAYFNPLAGGPGQGYRHLVDSSLDWGQDLPGLARRLERRDEAEGKEGPAYLSYFGTAEPEAHGVSARPLAGYPQLEPPGPPEPLRPGLYAMSATMLQAVYFVAPGPWAVPYEARYREALSRVRRWRASRGDRTARDALLRERSRAAWAREFWLFDQLRTARLAASLREREPDGQVGHSILLYELDAEALEAALLGPPPTLHPEPRIRVPEGVSRSELFGGTPEEASGAAP